MNNHTPKYESSKLYFDAEILKAIEWAIRYDEHDSDLGGMFATWWCHRKHTPQWLVLGKEGWKERWDAYVRQARQRVNSRSATQRCPDCGAKIKTRRCLACDIRRGMVARIEFSGPKVKGCKSQNYST